MNKIQLIEFKFNQMLDGSSENYFTPYSSKLIERAKLTITRVINGDRTILVDFYKFWQNINTKQELFDYFITCLAQSDICISNYTTSLILLLLSSKKLNDANIKCIKTIFSKVNNSDFTTLKDISIQSSCSFDKFFSIWLKHNNQSSIYPIASMLLYPVVIHKDDPFLSLYNFI